MNVDELQLHLSNLGQLLRHAGGKKTAAALDEFCQSLQPFRERRLKDVTNLLAKADEIVRTGTPPRKSKQKRQKIDTHVFEDLSSRIVTLYQRATEPDTTRERIERTFGELDEVKNNITVAQLHELAQKINVFKKFGKKQDYLDNMKQVIMERKGAFERAQV